MSKLKSKILVVDDNVGIRAALNILLSQYFGEVELLSSPKELLLRVRTFRPDVVLLDMNFESDINTGNEGLFWLSELKRNYPDVEVVLFTAYADIALAVEGMNCWASLRRLAEKANPRGQRNQPPIRQRCSGAIVRP